MSGFKQDLEVQAPKASPSALPAPAIDTEVEQPAAPAQPKKRVLHVTRWGKLVEIEPDALPPALPPRMPAPPTSYDNKGRKLSQEEALAQSLRKGERGPAFRVENGRVTNLLTGKVVEAGEERRSGGFGGPLVPGMVRRPLS
jgi:hypothetical protein